MTNFSSSNITRRIATFLAESSRGPSGSYSSISEYLSRLQVSGSFSRGAAKCIQEQQQCSDKKIADVEQVSKNEKMLE